MASIQELLDHKASEERKREQAVKAAREQDRPIQGTVIPIAQMRDGVRISKTERKRQQAEADEQHKKMQARERKRRAFKAELRRARNKRDDIIAKLQTLTLVRKDGKNVARRNCKAAREEAQAELGRTNRLINATERELARLLDEDREPKPERQPSRWERLRERDETIREIMSMRECIAKWERIDETTGGLTTAQYISLEQAYEMLDCNVGHVEWLNECWCRPRNGYPRPPFRRNKLYPKGALNRHPRGMNELARISGEWNRLLRYGTAMASVYGTGDKVVHMYEGSHERLVCVTRQRVLLNIAHQLERLNNQRIALGDERTVRRAGKHYYRMMLDSRLAKTLNV
jgi:hypothetical protein